MTKNVDDYTVTLEKLISRFPYGNAADTDAVLKNFVIDTNLVNAVIEEEGEEYSHSLANLIFVLVQNARENQLEERNPYRR
jgi:hypothetical protein